MTEDKYCKLHGDTLKSDTIEIVYGSNDQDHMQRLQSCEDYFPNANTLYLGGSFGETRKPQKMQTMYCPTCRDVERTLANSTWLMFDIPKKVSWDMH